CQTRPRRTPLQRELDRRSCPVQRRTPRGWFNRGRSIRMRLLRWFFVAFATMSAVHAQQYPSHPVALIVGFAAGGDSDLSGRNLAQNASKYLNKQPLVIINRVGAS